ncbi:MAG: SulP family inorganic anion transporter, partial [Bacteroidota bacterium]
VSPALFMVSLKSSSTRIPSPASSVSKFIPEAEQLILENILKDEAGEGILVLEDFKETIKRAGETTQKDIMAEAETLAAKEVSGVVGTIRVLPRAFNNINWLELGLALATIIIIYGFKRITTAIPSTLVALLIVSGIAYGFDFDYRPIEKIPEGLPLPNLRIFAQFSLSSITPYIFTALTLALLGAIDSLLTSVVADNMTKTKHKPNKELVGQGIGNSIAAIFGGIPGAGATIRTVVNINAGGKTKISGMIAGIILLIILLALGPVASQIPAAVLAGILVTVGIGVMDYKGLRAIPSLPKDLKLGPIKLSSEVIIMLVVLVLSSVWNLVYAVGIGLIIASLMFMKKMGDITSERSDVKPLIEEKAWADESRFPKDLKEKVFIKHIKGPLFFGSTSDFQQLATQIPHTARSVIIRMERMQYIDQSGLYALEDVLLDLKKNEIDVLLVNVLKQPKYMMERIDIIPDLIPTEHLFENFEDCLVWIKDNVSDKYPNT